jgi:hypothetical protein
MDEVRPLCQKLQRDELDQVTIDPLAATSTARGALPQIMKYYDRIIALPEFDRKNVDLLDTYARATHYAHNEYLAASSPPERFDALVEECTELRELLLMDATAAAKRDLIAEQPLLGLKGKTGYKNVASDLMTLCIMLRGAWPQLVGKTAVTEAELERAEILSDRLVNDVGLREQAGASINQVALERQQAFTLFVSAYDQVRRAISYLRWDEGDADDIAPSLYAGRGGGRKKTMAESETPTTAPAVTPTAAATPTAPSTATTGTATAKSTTGLPGADPFAN